MKVNTNLVILLTIRGCIQSALGECRTDLATFNLDTLEGEMKYSGSSKYDDCKWYLPTSENDDYALILYFEEITLPMYSEQECSGLLSIPDYICCQISAPYCRVHTYPGSECVPNDVITIASETCPECAGNTYALVKTANYIQLDSLFTRYKSFTLKYKFISCQKTTTANSARDQTTATVTTTNFVSEIIPSLDSNTENRTISKMTFNLNDGKHNALEPTIDTTYIITTAFLGSLLLLACILLVISYRRNKKKHSLQDVEFTRRRFKTSVPSRNNENATGEDSYAVIGRNQVQTYQSQQAVEIENAIYGSDLTSTSQGQPDVDSTYAVVNKNR